MRSLTVVCILMLLPTFGISQQGDAPKQHIATPEELIKTAITSGGWDGHMDKQFGNLGDAAAVAVTKVLPEGSLGASEIDSVLAILTISFADPSLVQVTADREPRATLFVLRHLDLLAQDSNTKKRIADTRRYVQEQFAKYKATVNIEKGSHAH